MSVDSTSVEKLAIGTAVALAFSEEIVDGSEAVEVRGGGSLAGPGLDLHIDWTSFSVDTIAFDPPADLAPDVSHIVATAGFVEDQAGIGFVIGLPDNFDFTIASEGASSFQLPELLLPQDDLAGALDLVSLGFDPVASSPVEAVSVLHATDLGAILESAGSIGMIFESGPALPMGALGVMPDGPAALEPYWWG